MTRILLNLPFSFWFAQTDVALLSLTACSTGLNLTRANVALFAELGWSPGVVLQAEDRIHRCVHICVVSAVCVCRPICKESVVALC